MAISQLKLRIINIMDLTEVSVIVFIFVYL